MAVNKYFSFKNIIEKKKQQQQTIALSKHMVNENNVAKVKTGYMKIL